MLAKTTTKKFLLDYNKTTPFFADFYAHLPYSLDKRIGYLPLIDNGNFNFGKNSVHVIDFIPEYVRPKIKTEIQLKLKEITTVAGYAIDLSAFNTFEDYQTSMPRKRRQALARSLRRLNQCLDVRFSMIQNTITRELYNCLMDSLKEMITRRFEQRPEESETLKVWDRLFEETYDLIMQGNASLYVCYNQEQPIFISLNYHMDKILFGYISSYDIDYGKFSLGQICVYKHVEWCFDNGYSLFEMGWGDLEYKKWWSNKIYIFKTQIFYSKNSIFAYLKTQYLALKKSLIAYLIQKKVNIYVRRLKTNLKQNNTSVNKGDFYKFYDYKLPENHSYIKLDVGDCTIPKIIINDFLFISQTNISNIEIYESNQEKKYILKGNKVTKKLVYT